MPVSRARSAAPSSRPERGAYGLRLTGVPRSPMLLAAAPDWPALHVVCELGDPVVPEERLTGTLAAYDPRTQHLYAGTADSDGHTRQHPYNNAILRIDANPQRLLLLQRGDHALGELGAILIRERNRHPGSGIWPPSPARASP